MIDSFKVSDSFKPQVATVPKKELSIVLPYLGNFSDVIKKRLTKTINEHLKFCKI